MVSYAMFATKSKYLSHKIVIYYVCLEFMTQIPFVTQLNLMRQEFFVVAYGGVEVGPVQENVISPIMYPCMYACVLISRFYVCKIEPAASSEI